MCDRFHDAAVLGVSNQCRNLREHTVWKKRARGLTRIEDHNTTHSRTLTRTHAVFVREYGSTL